jgi:positive regulator of sigma E activity
MLEQGIVKKVKHNLAFVEIRRLEKCDGCKLCAFGGNKSVVWPSIMKTECRPGDSVILEMPQKTMAGSSVLLFLLPLALFSLGLVAGMFLSELFMVLFGFIFALSGAVISFCAERAVRLNPKYAPVVVGRLESAPDLTDNANDN